MAQNLNRLHNYSMRIYLIKMSLLLVLSVSFKSWAKTPVKSPGGFFTGRIARLNEDAGIIRFKVNFSNLKYLNKKDQVQFWDERNPGKSCAGYVLGKSSDYLLVKVPRFGLCKKSVFVTTNSHLYLFSQDLVNNLKMGKSLVGVLLKKRLALGGKKNRHERELTAHIEKVNALNMRYKVLRDKLEAEWRKEIGNLDEDKFATQTQHNALEIEIANLDAKLERYRIEDESMNTDRWSLDPRIYYKK